MGSFLFIPTVFLPFLLFILVSGGSFSEFIYPDFSASRFHFIDNAGVFLSSRNGTFKAAIVNPDANQHNFYLCIIHTASNTIIWTANRDASISASAEMNLTAKGISISDDDGNPVWSTPQFKSSVSALLLNEMGNLILLDQFNRSLWESFQNPTDTIVNGQHLPVGSFLSSTLSNFSTGDYRLVLSGSDAILQWHGQTYWKLSMDTSAYTNSNTIVEYMAINGTGLQLLGRNGTVVVIQVLLSPSDFRIAKLDSSGKFIVQSFSGTDWEQEFVGPAGDCQIPSVCGRLGLCTASTTHSCSCPANFLEGSQDTGGCVPSGSYSLPVPCNSTDNGSQLNSPAVSYFRLDYGTDYFSNIFSDPVRYGVNLSTCQDLCSKGCSCLGIFYGNSSGSCYTLKDDLGSIFMSQSAQNDLLGYIKALVGSIPSNFSDNKNPSRKKFPVVALVLLPFSGFFLLVALGFLLWGRRGQSKKRDIKLGHFGSLSSGDMDAFYIPGLPRRFDFEELEVATDGFKTLIGSGGFGAVYKAVLPDNSVVAVKKIMNLGVQGKKDFCTEIAIIGNIHHANLVKLKGFCAQGRQRLLVYEYMNRSSLDRSLFGTGPVLEWQERLDIALGTARGLAYLHSGCEQKIIHCDVKPENILLHDQLQAKISDFGLSKLLTPEQSSLFTTMRGTRGYLAPEWLTNSAISEKTDVYSFGMVLLELVSGRKNTLRLQSHSLNNSGSGGGQSSSSSLSLLVYYPLFALEMHEQGRYLELVDLRLEGRVTSEEVEKFVRVALCCVQEDPTLRPSMNTVVGMLEGGIPLGQPNLESLNFLRFIGRGFTEASMIDEGTDQNDRVLYPEAYASTATMDSRTFFSYVSSQQLVKNTFLKNERTFSRKLVEMVLSLALERTMSKGEILSCYMSKGWHFSLVILNSLQVQMVIRCNFGEVLGLLQYCSPFLVGLSYLLGSLASVAIYWGHGIYGVESASAFFFGKHPSCLSLGESSMLAGLIPAPELRSPLRDPSRGKTFQARVLKRMVDVGYLDIETALSVMKQYLPLQVNESEAPIVLPPGGGRNSKFKDVWDWETESKRLEACEDMDRWAINVLQTTSPNSLVHPITGCDL